LKIVLFSNAFYPDIGGIESISEMLADAFVSKGNQVRILTKTLAAGNSTFPYTIVRNPGLIAVCKHILWADVVFENNPCLRISWPAFLLKRNHVTGLQTWIGPPGVKKSLPQKLKIAVIKLSSVLIACSKIVQQYISLNAQVIGNPYKQEIFKRLNHIPKTKDFVFLGRLVSDKGANLAIEAFNIFTRSTQGNSTLTVIGSGPEEAELHALVAKYGLSGSVHFTGSMRNEVLNECLNEHKYLLIPSLWQEPFGIVALEGMAAGCIPIVSDGGGLPDAVGNAGLIFKRGDVNDLVECMKNITQNAELEQALAAAAGAQLNKHTDEVVAQQYLAVFESVINRNK
jgi:glycosyltransferase involved in cell wall biosynthesis